MPWPSYEKMLLDLYQAIGEIRGMLAANSDRLNRIEDRLNKDRLRIGDLLPFLPGVIVVILWLSGRLDLAAALALLSGR